MALMKVEPFIGSKEFAKAYNRAILESPACDNYRSFMGANWCERCHKYEAEHAVIKPLSKCALLVY